MKRSSRTTHRGTMYRIVGSNGSRVHLPACSTLDDAVAALRACWAASKGWIEQSDARGRFHRVAEGVQS